MKVALYARVSTEDQHPENQKLALMRFVEEKGYEYEYFEEKESTRKTRPVKYALMQSLRAREFDAVIVWKLDRWARDMVEIIREIQELSNKNIKFISLTESVNIGTADGNLKLGIDSTLAQYERDKLRERINLGIAWAKKEGKHCGRSKGSKDKKQRRKSGYFARWAKYHEMQK